MQESVQLGACVWRGNAAAEILGWIYTLERTGVAALSTTLCGEENERYEFEINDKESCFLLLCAYVTGRQHGTHAGHSERENRKKTKNNRTILNSSRRVFWAVLLNKHTGLVYIIIMDVNYVCRYVHTAYLLKKPSCMPLE